MILKNLFLSEFENKKIFWEKRFCFVEKWNRADDIENGENQDLTEAWNEKLKFKINDKDWKREFDYFFKHPSSVSYVTEEIKDKSDLLRKYFYFATGKTPDLAMEREIEKTKRENDNYEFEINKLISEKKWDPENDNFIDSQIRAMKNEIEFNKKIIDWAFEDRENEFKNNFKKNVKSFESNFDNFFKAKEKNFLDKKEKIDKIVSNTWSKIPPFLEWEIFILEKFIENWKNKKEKFFWDNWKFNFEKFLETAKDQKKFDLEKKFEDEYKKLKDDEAYNSEYEKQNTAFSNVIEDFFKGYFAPLEDTEFNETNFNQKIQNLDEYIEYWEMWVDLKDCENLCELIPWFEWKCEEMFFDSNSFDFESLDKNILPLFWDEIKGFSEILKTINIKWEEDKNNIFLTWKLFKELNILVQKIYWEDWILKKIPEMKSFINEQNLDLSNFDDLIKIKEKLFEKFSLDWKLISNEDFEFSDEMKEMKIDWLESAIKNSLKFCKEYNENFSKKKDFIKDSDSVLESFMNGNYEKIQSLENSFKWKISKLKWIKDKIKENENDEIRKKYYEEYYNRFLKKIKSEYLNDVKSFEMDLAFKSEKIDKSKEQNDEFIANEWPQVVTLASIKLMFEKIYEEWKWNRDLDREIAEKRAAWVMAKSLDFPEAVNVWNSLIAEAKNRTNEFYSSNEDKYKSLTKEQLKSELKNFSEDFNWVFNWTALHWVLHNMAEKWIFSKNDKNMLKALHIKTWFLWENTDWSPYSEKEVDEKIQDFITKKSDTEKDDVLSRAVKKLHNWNDETYLNRLSRSESAFKAEWENAEKIRKAPESDKLFYNFRDEYLKIWEDGNCFDEMWCIKDWVKVELDEVWKINRANYIEWLNLFVKKKTMEVKPWLYWLIEAVATWIVPMEYAQTDMVLTWHLAKTFWWLDLFKKNLVSFEKMKEIYKWFISDENWNIIKYSYWTNLTPKQRKDNMIIEERVSSYIKKESDKFPGETEEEFFNGPNKRWMESTAWKVTYEKFEWKILWMQNWRSAFETKDDVSSFINWIWFELSNFWTDWVDKDWNFKPRSLHKNEASSLRETFKTFLAYRWFFVEKNYKHLKWFTAPVIDVSLSPEDLNSSKPAKYSWKTKNGEVKTLQWQSDYFYDIFREIDKTWIVTKNLDLNDPQKVAEYFDRWKWNFKDDVDKVFSNISDQELQKIILDFKNLDDFPMRTNFVKN